MKTLLRVYNNFELAILHDDTTNSEETWNLDSAIKLLKEQKEVEDNK